MSDNPIVGTFKCDECNTEATVLQTKRGKGKNLYVRCECGCDQRTGAAIQRKWAEQMTPREGFEHFKIEPEAQPKKEPEPTEPEPVTAEPETQEKPQEKAPSTGGILPVFGALCAVGLFVITMGKGGGVV